MRSDSVTLELAEIHQRHFIFSFQPALLLLPLHLLLHHHLLLRDSTAILSATPLLWWLERTFRPWYFRAASEWVNNEKFQSTSHFNIFRLFGQQNKENNIFLVFLTEFWTKISKKKFCFPFPTFRILKVTNVDVCFEGWVTSCFIMNSCFEGASLHLDSCYKPQFWKFRWEFWLAADMFSPPTTRIINRDSFTNWTGPLLPWISAHLYHRRLSILNSKRTLQLTAVMSRK